MTGFLTQLSPEVRRQVIDLLAQVGIERERIDSILSGSSTVDHGALIGLGDNDHPQYALLTALNDEATLRANQDIVLQNNIDAEEAARIAADALKADIAYVDTQDALKADISYVDTQDALKVSKTGDSMTGPLNVVLSAAGTAATLRGALGQANDLFRVEDSTATAWLRVLSGGNVLVKGFGVKDDSGNGSFYTYIRSQGVNTANRTLNINLGDATRTLTLDSNVSLNQNLLTTSTVTFHQVSVAGVAPTDVAHLTRKDYVDTQDDSHQAAAEATAAAALTAHHDAASTDHDDRYYTESEADGRFVNVTGDTITGGLTVQGGISTTAVQPISTSLSVGLNWFPFTDGHNYYDALSHVFRDEVGTFDAQIVDGQIYLGAATPVAASNATRKDYVDAADAANAAALNAHITDPLDAHDATAVSYDGTLLSPISKLWHPDTIVDVQNSLTTIIAEMDGRIEAGDVTAIIDALNAWTGGDPTLNEAGIFSAGIITADAIAAGAVVAAKIAASSIDASKIVASTITTTQIAASTILGGNIAADTITAANIAADTITAAEIAANAITASELAANSVVAGKIAAGTIVAADIAADTITAAQIAADAITASEIAANAVTASEIAAGAVTTSKLSVVPSSGNMVLNGNFADADFAGTWLRGNTTIDIARITDPTSPVGPNVATIDIVSGTGADMRQVNHFAIEDGKEYVLTAWFKHDLAGATPGNYYFRVMRYSSDGTYLGYTDLVANDPNSTIPSWTKKEFRTTFPAGTSMLKLSIFNYGSSTGILYVTGISCVPSMQTIDLADGVITTPKLVAGSVTTDKMTADSINGDRITAGTLDASKITAGSITTDRMTAGTIDADRLTALSITATQIAADAITATKIKSDAITSSNYIAPPLPGDYAVAGSYLNLANGDFQTPGFLLDGVTGDVTVKGDLTGTAFSLLDNTTGDEVLRLDELVGGYFGVDGKPALQFFAPDATESSLRQGINWNYNYSGVQMVTEYDTLGGGGIIRGSVNVGGASVSLGAFYSDVATYVTLDGEDATFGGNVEFRPNSLRAIGNIETWNTFIGVNATLSGTLSMGSVIGDRIHVYGTTYSLGIAGGTLYYNSDGIHEFRIGGTGGRAYIATNYIGANGNSIKIGSWDQSPSTWTGSVQGSCGYLLIGYSGGAQQPIYLRTNNGTQPVYIGAGGQNALTVGTADITVASSAWVGYQFRSTYSSSSTSYTTANAFLGNGGSQAVMSLWSNAVASQFRQGANVQVVYHRIWDDSAYSTFNSIINNFSSVHAKQNIETWPVKGASVGAAANSLAFPSALETAMALRPVKYQWKPNVLLTRAPSPRRAEAVDRLNKIREGKGQPKWQEENPEEFTHNCQERPEECSPGPNGECLVMRDWEEGQVGFIAQEVAEVLPQAAKLDVKSGEYELLDGVALSAVAIGAIQELTAKVEELQARIEALEAKA